MNFITTIDQLGKTHQVPFPPKRIVSLVPSQTEYLFDLGLENQIVGVTRFCVHPQHLTAQKEDIGGTKNLKMEAIHQLKPDLIIGNKEENSREQIADLCNHYPVWMSDVDTVEQAYNMMSEIARVTDRINKGQAIIDQAKLLFNKLKSEVRTATVAYFIWRKPYMVAASQTYINDLLKQTGFINVFSNSNRYPEIEIQALAYLKPQYIFLSSEPYRFTAEHFCEFKEICPSAKVVLVDGEMFSWYGSRLLAVPQYILELNRQLTADNYSV